MTEQAVKTEQPRSWLRTGLAPRWRWLAWGLFAAAWTAALLTTFPIQVRNQVVEDDELRFSFGKLLHVGAYAFFAVLTSWQRLSVRGRRLCLLGLIIHAGLTELCQCLLVPGRTGSWTDVGLNLIGLSIGAAITWKRWFERVEESNDDDHQHLSQDHQQRDPSQIDS